MSVVVEVDEPPSRSCGRPRIATSVHELPQIVLRCHPAGDLAIEPAVAVGASGRACGRGDGRRGPRVGPGSATRAERNRRRTSRSAAGDGQGLRVREVAGRDAEALADEVDRPVEFVGDVERRRGGRAARACGCATPIVTKPVRRARQRGPTTIAGRPSSGNGRPLLDEVSSRRKGSPEPRGVRAPGRRRRRSRRCRRRR